MMETIEIDDIIMVTISVLFTNKILPNKKLNKSTENPFVELIKITPKEKPNESNTAIRESDGRFVICLIFVILIEATIDRINAVHNG